MLTPNSTPLAIIVKRWSRYFAILCFLIATLVLIGWQFNVDVFKQPLPGLAAMNPTTAVCFLLTAASLLLLGSRHRKIYPLAYTLVVVSLIIGCLRLAGVLKLISIEIDLLLFTKALATTTFNDLPARMAPIVATNFVLTSIGILIINLPNKNISQGVSSVIGLVSMFSVLGYMYNVPEFYGRLPYLPMALHTAFCFLLIASALFTFHSEEGLSKEIFSARQGSVVARFLLPVVFIVPVILGYIRLWAHWTSLISTEFGVSVLVVCIILVIVIVVFITIRLLNRRDEQQKSYQEILLALNKDLQNKNDEIVTLNEEMQASNEEMLAANEELTVMNEQLAAASEKIREQSETIVKQKDEQLNRVLDSSMDVIWSIDLTEKKESYLSRSAEKLFGGAISEEMLTDHAFWIERTHEDDRITWKNALSQLHETGASECTYRIRALDDQYLWIHHRSRLVYDKEKQPIRYEGIVTNVTEFKKQQEVLNQYRENLDVIFSNTVEEILLLDHEGKIVLFNKALELFITSVTGRKPEVGRYVWDTTLKGRSQSSKQLFARALKGEAVTVDAHIQTEAGEIIHELRYEPVSINGRVKYVTVISVDVTEKKRRENLLRQSEANLRSIFEHTEDAFTLLDKDCNIIMFNSASQNIAAENFQVGANIFDVLGDQRQSVFREYLNRVDGGETVKYDIQIGERSNSAWYHVTVAGIRSNEDLVGYCITTNNHTAIKLAEMTLKESEERFRALIENSQDIFALKTPEGKLTYVNPGVEKITGYSYQELLSMDDSKILLHQEDLNSYMSFFNDATNNPGKVVSTSFRMKHKNGNWQWMEGTAVNLSDHDSINGVVMNFRDVTQRKLSESEKSELVGQLIEQNNDLRQFSFIASHNLRGPVASLLGLFNLLSQHEMSPDVAQIISMAIKSVNHLDNVIRDLSMILEMRTHKLHAKEYVRIRDTIELIKAAIEPQIIECQAKILINDNAVNSFHTIKSYFYSVLYNLISNAVKYRSSQRELIVEIKTFKTSTSTGFSIKDNGIGINLEQFRERIFGLYQRFHLEAEGKGLGLYMVKTQVQLLNGIIEVDSKQEEGTVFTVTFPLHTETNN